METEQIAQQAGVQGQNETQERIVSAAVNEVLAAVRQLKEPLQRRALQKAVERIQGGSAGDEGPRLRIDKARGALIPLVRFLTGCTFREKLAAYAFETLTCDDIAQSLGPGGYQLYDGDISKDLQSWEDEIDYPDERDLGTPEERILAAYVSGLSIAR